MWLLILPKKEPVIHTLFAQIFNISMLHVYCRKISTVNAFSLWWLGWLGMSENHRTPQDTTGHTTGNRRTHHRTPQDTPQETAGHTTGHPRTPQDTPQDTAGHTTGQFSAVVRCSTRRSAHTRVATKCQQGVSQWQCAVWSRGKLAYI